MKNIQVRVEEDVKDKADKLFDALGTTTNEAIKIFLSTSIREKGFPFEIKLPQTRTMEEYISEKMLSITDEEFREALTFIQLSGRFIQDTEFEGVVHEQVEISGFLDENAEEAVTVAESRIVIYNTDEVDLLDAADSESGDLLVVAAAITSNEEFGLFSSQVAIIDELYMFAPTALAKDRVEMAERIVKYLNGRGIYAVAFMSAGIWRTDSIEERKALTLALKNSDMFKRLVTSKEWETNIYGYEREED
ncbi:MAG TPA: type II toxin-antitoxin system RelB/DinJ family antitoxin [Lactobacillaceae bacterium]|jgi:DNA-damage-inducible protein J